MSLYVILTFCRISYPLKLSLKTKKFRGESIAKVLLINPSFYHCHSQNSPRYMNDMQVIAE